MCRERPRSHEGGRSRARVSRLCVLGLVLVALAITSAATPVESDWVLIPIGRSAVDGPNTFEVVVDGAVMPLSPIADGCGGYWLRMPGDLPAEASVVLQFTVAKEHAPGGYSGEPGDRWLEASPLIDSDDPLIATTAAMIAPPGASVIEGALALHTHVASTLEWRYYEDYMADPASRTLELGYGTCANSARLFVALCRAAQIPARTVRGVSQGGDTFDTYHQWAEIQDEDGIWHPLDPLCEGSFDLADLTCLDLMYAAEENPFLDGFGGDPDIRVTVLYDTQPMRGRLGFRIVESTSQSFVLENTYKLPTCAHG